VYVVVVVEVVILQVAVVLVLVLVLVVDGPHSTWGVTKSEPEQQARRARIAASLVI